VSARRGGVPVAEVAAELERTLGARCVARLELPPEPERLADDIALAPAVAAALAARGVRRLWSHQAEALAALAAGENVLLTTATASGKSLVFQLPALEEALAGGPGRALWIFPLKALGQDQRAKFRELAAAAGLDDATAGCEIYDGDTPAARRAALRQRPPRVLITNPDMLHLGLLPHAAAWHELLAGLRWIVLDELHAYRGVFGVHVHHVLARLDRLARAAGARPQIVAASATAANADEFARSLAGRDFRWIAGSGAPRARRHFLVVRPETSPYTTALETFAALLRAGLKTIVFTKARRITELLWTWLERREPELARRVRSYRAGYLPAERREIERALAEGRLDGVLSTSALELGIDIGGLDACVLVGYPGSAMATWQRAGRVGRGGRESIVVLVAQPDALDQYLCEHPEELLARPLERLVLDPDNETVARQQLVCAAAELPLATREDGAYLERFAPVVGELIAAGQLARSAGGDEIVSLARRPQRNVSLRGTGAQFAIVERASGESIGAVDGARVFAECHPGAIYLHAGRQYAVDELDLERHLVRVVPADVDWYTAPRSEKETEILEVLAERAHGSLLGGFGRLRVTERVVGFERRRTHLFEAIDVQPLDLPPVVYETQGLWFRAPAGAERALLDRGGNLLGALHAVEHGAIGLFPLVALCDRNDLGGISLTSHPQLASAGVFVYEGHAGGVGITKRGFAALPELLGHVLALLERCPCEAGCPNCIHSPKCGNGNRPLDKAGAVEVLKQLLAAPAAPAQAGATASPKETEKHSSKGKARRVEEPGGGVVENLVTRRQRRKPEPYPSMESLSSEDGEAPAFAARGAAPRGGAEAALGTVLFDLETRRSAEEVGGWSKAHRMGMALAVALHLEEGRFETFFEPDAERLVATLKRARLVVGYNSRRFDYAVLAGYTGEELGRLLPTLDLLETLHGRLGFRVGLDHVARETLGRGKSGDGLQSLEWVRDGRLDLVEAYCRRDVEILRDVYLHGRREGFVLVSTKAGRIRVPVDW
jgi:DEAD/DEAH box helicase domain-containing protein